MTAGSPRGAPADTAPVRPEDAVDPAALHRWLAGRVAGLQGAPQVRQFRGGASNLTYLLRYPGRELVLRRPPAGHKAASAHDMGREYEVQRRLRPSFPAVPEVLARCTDPEVIGSEFYVMAYVPGLVLRAELPPGVALPPPQARALALRTVDLLADLHSVDVAATGLGVLYRGPGYVRRQVEGWSRRYVAARTDDVPAARAVMAWLAEHQPDDVGACVVHGDWRLDNLVLDPADLSAVRAVLDWEMATVGDPLMDLGASLAYWVEAGDDERLQAFRRQPSHLPGMPTRSELVEHYLSRTGRPVADWQFYEVYGLFRLAVIVQQIWYRYRAGSATDPAFAGLGPEVVQLVGRCEAALR